MGLTRAATGSRATRERLLDAAEACFEHRPAERVSLEHVARAAGLSRSLIYRHFANRRQLAAEVALRRERRHLRQAADIIRAQRSFADGIVDGLIFLSRQRPRDGGLDEADQAAVVWQAAAQLWVPVLTEASRNGDVRPDLDVEAAATSLALMGFVSGGLDRRAMSEDAPREMLARFLVPALLGRDPQPAGATSGRAGKPRPA